MRGYRLRGLARALRAGFDRGSTRERSAWKRRGLRLLRCTAAALPALAFVFWVPSSWVMDRWAELAPRARALVVLSYVLLFLGTLSVSVGASWLAGRYARAAPPRLHSLLPLVLLLLGAACYAADRVVLVGLYEEFHYGLFGGFSICLAAFIVLGAAALRHVRPTLKARGPRLRALSVLFLAVALSLAVAFEFAVPDVFGPSQSVAFSKLVATGRTLTDFDADGVSGLFGGSDCDGFDENSGPDQFDFPGNGTDEDCTGKDARWPKPRPRLEYPVPDLAGC